jgi:hypothetical protein
MTQRTTIIASIDLQTLQPLTFTHHGTDGLPLLTRGIDTEGRHQRTVFIPAAQLRGRLRHEAALAELRSRPEKAKLEEAYLLALGQDLRPSEEEEPEAIRLQEQLRVRAQNPLLDLFGTWKMASRLFVSHLMPEVNVLPDKVSHIRRDLDSNTDMMEALGEDEQNRLYERQDKQGLASKAGALIKLVKRELAATRKAKDPAKLEQLNAKLEELEELKKTHKGEDESDNTKHLLDLQVIPAGITLSGKLTVNSATGQDLKTLIRAFDGFSQMPYLGAQRARGCGEVQGCVIFKTSEGSVLAVIRFGGFKAATIEWTEAGSQLIQPNESALAV